MNNSNNSRARVSKRGIKENEEINTNWTNKTSDKTPLEKNENIQTKSVENTLNMLNSCAKVMIEDFNSSWVDHYRQYYESLNKVVHNMLKYSSDHKKRVEAMRTNSVDRKKKIELLLTIKDQFGKNF